MGKIRKILLGGLPKPALAFRQAHSPAARYLGNVFFTVVRCYHATLEDDRLDVLLPKLNAVAPDLRGFAYEGAAMGLMQLDCVLPWQNRLQPFMAGPAAPYSYPASMGTGLALARLRKQPEQFFGRLDPLLRWLAIDGYGFRHGIFARPFAIERQAVPEHLSAYARCAFDHGLGRSLWFATGADVARIAATLAAFPHARQQDLWSGVSFACAYAGGAERAAIETLSTIAERYRPQLALGAALGAKGRQRGGNLVPHTDLACEILCGTSGDEAAQITDMTMQNLPADGVEPAYAIWRQRIQMQFAAPVGRELGNSPQLVH
jgi:enediyne biosynthesis protein E3